jgi:hypothetical protein
LWQAVSSGAAPFSVEDDQTGGKRQAYADDLTEGQLYFIFHAKQEREKIKQEKAEREKSRQQMKQNFG